MKINFCRKGELFRAVKAVGSALKAEVDFPVAELRKSFLCENNIITRKTMNTIRKRTGLFINNSLSHFHKKIMVFARSIKSPDFELNKSESPKYKKHSPSCDGECFHNKLFYY